jgi:hypothetical protein
MQKRSRILVGDGNLGMIESVIYQLFRENCRSDIHLHELPWLSEYIWTDKRVHQVSIRRLAGAHFSFCGEVSNRSPHVLKVVEEPTPQLDKTFRLQGDHKLSA